MNHQSIGVLLMAMFAIGCQRCGNATTPDASMITAPSPEKKSIDVRTALFTIFPEFRWAVVTRGFAAVERTVEWKEGTQEKWTPLALEKGFSKGDAVTLFSRPPFALEIEQSPSGEFRCVAGLPIRQEDISRLLQAPSPLTSEQIAQWLPVAPNSKVLKETFFLELEYQGKTEARTDYLVRQMVDLLLAGPWTLRAFPEGWQQGRAVDGGVGAVPHAFEFTLNHVWAGSRVDVSKRGDRVAVRFSLPTSE